MVSTILDDVQLKRHGCINCGETAEGGYEIEEVGPFCSSCWIALRAHFYNERNLVDPWRD